MIILSIFVPISVNEPSGIYLGTRCHRVRTEPALGQELLGFKYVSILKLKRGEERRVRCHRMPLL
jgi:hypothetical protein